MFLSSRRVETYTCWPSKVKFNIWPQVKVTVRSKLTQVGRVAYQSMRHDQTNILRPTTLFYVYSIESYRPKTPWPHMTSNDLEAEVIGSKLCMGHQKRRVIRISWDYGDARTRIYGMEGIWIFSHCLIMAEVTTWPDLRSRKSKFRDIHFAHSHTII